MRFTPDGSYVFFTGISGNETIASIFSVPALGGSVLKVISNAGSPSFSPDGMRVAFTRTKYDPDGIQSALVIADASGSNEREIVALKKGQLLYKPVWSPDAKSVVGSVLDNSKLRLTVIDISDGTLNELPIPELDFIAETAWLPDMSAIICSGSSSVSGLTRKQIWEISYPSGKARRLSHNTNDYSGLSMTADGKTIITIETDLSSDIWVSKSADPREAQLITSGKARYPGISWTPDNRLVYASNSSGEFELWSMNADGTEAIQLTNDRLLKQGPTTSADGRYIVYEVTGNGHIWRIDINGGGGTQLTTGLNEMNVDISPDDKWVVYSAWTSGKMAIWRVPLEGGEAEQITSSGSMHSPRVSPDGKQIAVMMIDDRTEIISIAIIPFQGGEPTKRFEVPQTIDFVSGADWTPDGKGLTYILGPKGAGNLWLQQINGGKPTQLTDYKENGVWQRQWSHDGKQVALVRGEINSDAIMISNFR